MSAGGGTAPKGEIEPSEFARKHLQGLAPRVDALYCELEFSRGIEQVMAALREANRVFTWQEPWVASKKVQAQRRAGEEVSFSCRDG